MYVERNFEIEQKNIHELNADHNFSVAQTNKSSSSTKRINPLMPSGSINICCPRDCVSRTANVEGTARH